jgi:hypothetical protein
MTRRPLLQRLRDADPAPHTAPAAAVDDAALFAAIVATPVDPRLAPAGAASRGRRRRRLAARLGVLVAVLGIGGATAWATGAADPDSRSAWHQQVIPASVHRATTITIPGIGPVELWYGDARQGGFCTALRLPDGRWQGTLRSPLDGGGAEAGCRPTREQINAAGPTPVLILDGFDYVDAVITPPGGGPGVWRVDYGVVRGRRPPVRVVDRVSGRETPVAEHRLFALAQWDPHPSGRPRDTRFVALDAAGRVVAGSPRPAGP